MDQSVMSDKLFVTLNHSGLTDLYSADSFARMVCEMGHDHIDHVTAFESTDFTVWTEIK
jgi:hypothetical protein